ncbi:hypothetical protein NQ314_004758 [Rhamnusium bicolor]|uniref:PiggyBac transposable element-derived protein domain-containing protein n=1 Tax=Rhamnusium bicolor TaxID=1586634 RepID=A0AAV8ZJ37_9CUCU|nr:hypothetical protein NQ314_004758 [Rhamnusium bicolor]
MGDIKINHLRNYWKTNELYNLPCFRSYMSRNRFLTILRCLHFSKNPERCEPGYDDRLSKIRWLQDFFKQRIDDIYYPDKQLSLDESMVLWRGRLLFQQYVKNKNHKFEVKLYILSKLNGFVLKVRIYTRYEKNMQGELGHSANVAFCLLKNYLENGHSLYTDNCYISFALSKELLLKRTYVTGTLRQNRRGNQSVASKKLSKGETVTKYCNAVEIGKWREKGDHDFRHNVIKNLLSEVEDSPADRPKDKPKTSLTICLKNTSRTIKDAK